MSQDLESHTITFSDLGNALLVGAQHFRQSKVVSIAYSALFTLIGLVLYIILEAEKIAPMSYSLAVGFMLVGPAILVGFFSISDALDQDRRPRAADIFKGFRQISAGLWGLSMLCMFLFMIWITEAATIYAIVVGPDPIGFLGLVPPGDKATSFIIFASLGVVVIAFIVFTASAFAVPLMIYTNVGMVKAIVNSVRAVFKNFFIMMVWALLLVILIMGAAWFLPLLPLTLPVCAYASLALYRAVFKYD